MTTTHSFDNTCGIVVCGGKSSRMGSDKSLLTYHDKPQRNHLYDLLTPHCDKVLISCNAEQAKKMGRDLPFIQDDETFGDVGPIKALLTACDAYHQLNILLVGCDYPFLTTADLVQFAALCRDKPAAFFNESAAKYEPLLAWYPADIFSKLKEYVESGGMSLQHFLMASDAVKYRPVNKNCLISANTYEAYESIRKQLKQ